MVEIYKSEAKHPKTYLVADFNHWKMKKGDQDKLEDLINYSMQYFKVKCNRLFLTTVWVLNDEMYFENPHKKGQRKCSAICLINNELLKRIGLR